MSLGHVAWASLAGVRTVQSSRRKCSPYNVCYIPIFRHRGISGAIAALFFMGQGWEPRKIRPTISGFNGVVSSVTLMWLLTTHSIGRSEILSAAMFLPLVFIGLALSNLVRHRVDGRHFRVITFALVVVAGLLAVIAGVIEMAR